MLKKPFKTHQKNISLKKTHTHTRFKKNKTKKKTPNTCF